MLALCRTAIKCSYVTCAPHSLLAESASLPAENTLGQFSICVPALLDCCTCLATSLNTLQHFPPGLSLRKARRRQRGFPHV